MRAHEFTDQGAAGIILYAEDTGRWGLQQRSDSINDPGLWAAWGGGREPGESLEQCAKRELSEESGYHGPIRLEPLAKNAKYVTFIGVIPHEFEPTPCEEWKDYCWTELGDWPKPMHPGTAAALENVYIKENFADGKHPEDKGDSKRYHVPTKSSVSSLRKFAKNHSGRAAQLAHWMANMKSGKKKTNESKVDPEQFSTEKLDELLQRCIKMVFEKGLQRDDKSGRVGACIIDPRNRKVFAVTTKNSDGDWIHAEHMAIKKYHKEFGKILPGSIIVTTLSPCNREMYGRSGPSCQDLLQQVGIEKVYTGYMDPTQHSDHPFEETVTKNDDLWRDCKRLSDSFVHQH